MHRKKIKKKKKKKVKEERKKHNFIEAYLQEIMKQADDRFSDYGNILSDE